MRALVVGLVCLAACGDNAPRNACPGARPQLSECFVGNSFAECGGSGEPAFACGLPGQCLWFSDGCVAEGFTASTCDADDACCHDMSPFEADDVYDTGVAGFMLSYGTAPWDRDRSVVISASVDPLLVGTANIITCTGPRLQFGGSDPFDAVIGDIALGQNTVTASAGPVDLGLAAWFYDTEIVPDATGGLAARMCISQYTDVLPPACRYSRDPLCAITGSVRLNRWPTSGDDRAGLVATVDATFATGLRVQATLVNEPNP